MQWNECVVKPEKATVKSEKATGCGGKFRKKIKVLCGVDKIKAHKENQLYRELAFLYILFLYK